MRVVDDGHTLVRAAEDLSFRTLVGEITSKAYLLARKEVDLAKAELREDLRAQLTMVKALAAALVAGIAGLSVLLVALVLGLATVMPGWLAALLVGGVTLTLAGAAGLYGWNRRVRNPLDATRRTLREDLQMGETTRVIGQPTTNGAQRPAAIEDEIRGLRVELDHLIDELDRRRREMLDVKLQVRRHVVPVSVSAFGLALAAAGAVAYSAWRRPRRQTFVSRAGRLREAVSRMIASPERVAVEPARARILSAAVSAVAAVVVRDLLRLLRRRLEARAHTPNLPGRPHSGVR